MYMQKFSYLTGNCVTVRFHAIMHGHLDMSLMIHVIDRCYQIAFMRDKTNKYSSVHRDRKQCEKGGIGAINKTGLDYYTDSILLSVRGSTSTVRYLKFDIRW